MDLQVQEHRFDTVTRLFGGESSRRRLVRGLAAAGLGFGGARLPERVAAKKRRKGKPKRRKGLCRKDGAACTRPGKTCKQTYCLRAPFTVETRWPEQADHAIVLFVPPQNATTGPAPYIHNGCTPSDSDCEEAYPFACFAGDEPGAGDEVATIYRLLPGTYEYWIEFGSSTVAGEVTVALKDGAGRVVRQWANPATAEDLQVGWHLFDVDGRDGRVTAINELIAEALPYGAHDPSTHVCPE